MDFEISKTYTVKSIRTVRREFFKYHVITEGKSRIAAKPNALILNPSHLVRVDDEFIRDVWVTVYCRGYYVEIEKSIHRIGGPHPAKLYIQVYPGKTGVHLGKFVHLGTTQFSFNFFDRKTLLKRLSKAMRKREYFATDELQDEIIEFDEAVVKVIEL